MLVEIKLADCEDKLDGTEAQGISMSQAAGLYAFLVEEGTVGATHVLYFAAVSACRQFGVQSGDGFVVQGDVIALTPTHLCFTILQIEFFSLQRTAQAHQSRAFFLLLLEVRHDVLVRGYREVPLGSNRRVRGIRSDEGQSINADSDLAAGIQLHDVFCHGLAVQQGALPFSQIFNENTIVFLPSPEMVAGNAA